MKKHRALGAEALFAAAFTYALTGILVREVSPMWGDKAQVAVRFTIVLALLVVYYLFRKNKPSVPKNKLSLVAWLGIMYALIVLFFTSAIGKTTVANVLFVFYATNMIVAFLLGSLLLKENISRNKLLSLGFALTGLAVYSEAIIGGNLGIILSIAAGLGGGVSSLVSKQLSGVDRGAALVGQYAVAAIICTAVTLISSDQIIRSVSARGTVLIIAFALVILLGSYLSLYGFQNFDVNIGTVIMSAEIVFAAVMAYFLYDEVPKLHELVGGALILTGSIIGSGIFDKEKSQSNQIAQPD